jgi:hypothetical protein
MKRRGKVFLAEGTDPIRNKLSKNDTSVVDGSGRLRQG